MINKRLQRSLGLANGREHDSKAESDLYLEVGRSIKRMCLELSLSPSPQRPQQTAQPAAAAVAPSAVAQPSNASHKRKWRDMHWQDAMMLKRERKHLKKSAVKLAAALKAAQPSVKAARRETARLIGALQAAEVDRSGILKAVRPALQRQLADARQAQQLEELKAASLQQRLAATEKALSLLEYDSG